MSNFDSCERKEMGDGEERGGDILGLHSQSSSKYFDVLCVVKRSSFWREDCMCLILAWRLTSRPQEPWKWRDSISQLTKELRLVTGRRGNTKGHADLVSMFMFMTCMLHTSFLSWSWLADMSNRHWLMTRDSRLLGWLNSPCSFPVSRLLCSNQGSWVPILSI